MDMAILNILDNELHDCGVEDRYYSYKKYAGFTALQRYKLSLFHNFRNRLIRSLTIESWWAFTRRHKMRKAEIASAQLSDDEGS